MESTLAFDEIAETYDDLFDDPIRAAYDALAWERVSARLPVRPGVVVDAGCGTGRWARQLADLGHDVIGIDVSGAMVARARSRGIERFVVVEGSMNAVDLPESAADVVMAMGSIQYTADPRETIRHVAAWLKPGGSLCVLVDSLMGLAIELARLGRSSEAKDRLRNRVGIWKPAERPIVHHLLTSKMLEQYFQAASLIDIRVSGLLVGASALGRDCLTDRLNDRGAWQLDIERRLANVPELSDLGKHLFVSGRAPPQPSSVSGCRSSAA